MQTTRDELKKTVVSNQEAAAKQRDIDIKGATISQLNSLWEEVK